MWKKIAYISLWVLLAVATCTLLIASMQKKEAKKCTDIQIEISGAEELVFVDKKEVLRLMKDNGAEKGKVASAIDLQKIESILSKNAWVKKAELFFDNDQVLHTMIEEREPIARIFALQGSSFYIDSSCKRLPLSDKLSARVPMFTSFPSDKKILSHPDSMVLQDVKMIARYILQDSFWMAQVAQINITLQGNYEMVPVLGNQLIKMGNAERLDEKFSNLLAFYKQVWSKTGFEKYETIDVQYTGQVVATKRNAASIKIDTVKAMQVLASTQQQMRSVLKDTAFAIPVARPIGITEQDTLKQDPVKVNGANKEAVKKPLANKKIPKAILKKPR